MKLDLYFYLITKKMIYKLKHGDTFKVLPIIMKDNTFNSHISVLSAYWFNKIIYDFKQGYLYKVPLLFLQ